MVADLEAIWVEPLDSIGSNNLLESVRFPSISPWVRQRILKLTKDVGLSDKGFELEMLDLILAMDRARPRKVSTPAKKKNSMGSGSRELRSLATSINYDQQITSPEVRKGSRSKGFPLSLC